MNELGAIRVLDAEQVGQAGDGRGLAIGADGNFYLACLSWKPDNSLPAGIDVPDAFDVCPGVPILLRLAVEIYLVGADRPLDHQGQRRVICRQADMQPVPAPAGNSRHRLRRTQRGHGPIAVIEANSLIRFR